MESILEGNAIRPSISPGLLNANLFAAETYKTYRTTPIRLWGHSY